MPEIVKWRQIYDMNMALQIEESVRQTSVGLLMQCGSGQIRQFVRVLTRGGNANCTLILING
jgi:hypothetical protein